MANNDQGTGIPTPDFSDEDEFLKNLHNLNNGQSQGPQEVTAETLLKMKPERIATLLDPIIPQVGICCLAGSSDVGKSAILRQLAVSISHGDESFLGFRINARYRSVLFAASEDDQHATAFLLYRQAAGCDPASLSGLRFLFEFENLLAETDKSLTNQPADAVIIDCFSDVFGQDLKDTQRIRNFLNPYKAMAEKHQTAFIFLHHTGKRTENYEPSKNNLLSGQGLESKMRLVIELRQDHTNPMLRHLCIVKGNYLPASMKRESYVLSFNEENFRFQNTGDRVPFELLAKPAEDSGKKEKYLKAVDLKALGYTLDQIARELGYANKSSVSRLLEEGKSKGWGNVA